MAKTYAHHIAWVIQYIDDNITESISMPEVAEAGQLSSAHLHRIFRKEMDETINNYIVRRKVERAVRMLISQPDMHIKHIALANGYSSSANFAKAVNIYFGYSASELRNPIKAKSRNTGTIYTQYGKRFNPIDIYRGPVINTAGKKYLSGDFHVEIKTIRSLCFCTFAYSRGYEIDQVVNAYDKVCDWAEVEDIPDEEKHFFAICYDDPVITPAERCRFSAGISVEPNTEIAEPFKRLIIPKGKYAVLHFKGKPKDATKARLSLFSNWLPRSGYTQDDYPLIERHLSDPSAEGRYKSEMYVKLK